MLNKKMLLSILIIGTVAVVAGAGTWAAFSDNETSANNTLTAGTLDLTINSSTGVTISNVAPNDKGVVGTIQVKNNGTIDGNLSVNITNVENNGNGIANDAEDDADSDNDGDGEGELGDHINVTITDGNNSLSGNLSTFTTLDLGALGAGASKDLTISYEVDDAGNEIQGDSVEFDLEFSLVQQ